jgi:hypothetical protein
MVRAGVVNHPSEWDFGGYNEIPIALSKIIPPILSKIIPPTINIQKRPSCYYPPTFDPTHINCIFKFNVLKEKIQCLMQNPGSDPVASAASGFYPTFDKLADKRPAVLSAVENCIEETVQNGTERIQHILRAIIWIKSLKRPPDPHRLQLNQMLKRIQVQPPKAGSTCIYLETSLEIG